MRLVSGDLDAPDWSLSADGDDEQEQRARDELADKLAKMVVAVGAWPIGAQARWQSAAAREVAWREGVEASRGILRLCLRAWRELKDGIQAGTAAWEQRWGRSLSGSGECALACRLTFGARTARQWADGGGMVRMMLAWLRIVGAGTVHARRRRSDTWRSIDTAWRSRIACVHFDGALPLSYSPQMNWQREEAVASARGVSSGAAAVLTRRRGRDDDSGTPSENAAGMRTAHDKRRKVARTMGAGAGTSAAHAAAGAAQVAADRTGDGAPGRTDGSAHAAGRGAVVSRSKSAQNFGEKSFDDELFCSEVLHASGPPAGTAVGAHAELAAEQGQRARRRTDAALSLTTQAYEAMAVQLCCARWHAERQEGGRRAHARRRRGDG